MIYYALSDIHGHLDALQAAVAHVPLDAPETQLILLGDYVARGPASHGVLEFVRDLQEQQFPDRVIALLGNHDAWLLDWISEPHDDIHWLLSGGFDTLRSFLSDEGHLYIDGGVELPGGQLNLVRIDSETGGWSELAVTADVVGTWQPGV